jgi:hypothetical protein
MNENVVPLRVVEIGEGVHLQPDKVLSAALGKLDEVVVIGLTEDGEPFIASSEGVAKALWLIEKCKLTLFDFPSAHSVV